MKRCTPLGPAAEEVCRQKLDSAAARCGSIRPYRLQGRGRTKRIH